MSEAFEFTYQTLNGLNRKVEFEPIPGSSHWTRTAYEKRDGEWDVCGSAEVKYVELEGDNA